MKTSRCQRLQELAGGRWARLTQAWREQHHIQVGQKLLLFGVKVAETRDDVSRQTDTDYFEDGLKDQEAKMPQRRMRLMGVR